ncbi:SDR family oxidoreductase [Sphingobium sp. JS3065]|uniref:SDR family oxidoreductase n=1 Tax=Sphingobium sp. JS3065 TaxID=2970925 RepID=UPI002263D849|nr:SDR family oxidoreductase [Sphingobium sp. JS3065]UZW57043.1 SDR family oxidoreductase [Sphingobium sp. JS3065]
MDLNLKGKRAIIMGASYGIGASCAEALAAEGCNVIIVSRSMENLEITRKEIAEKYDVEVRALTADISSHADIVRLSETERDVDIVVNVAGMNCAGSLLEVEEPKMRAGFETKVFGYINMCRQYYPILKARGGGVIVNVVGVGALARWDWYPYGGSINAAVNAFTQSVGSESLHRDNIRVLVVNPGLIMTPRVEKYDAQLAAEGKTMFDFGRPGADPSEVASVVAFMASDRASYVTGTAVNVDGGLART